MKIHFELVSDPAPSALVSTTKVLVGKVLTLVLARANAPHNCEKERVAMMDAAKAFHAAFSKFKDFVGML